MQSTQEVSQKQSKSVRIELSAYEKLSDLAFIKRKTLTDYISELVDERYTRYSSQLKTIEQVRKEVA